MTRFIRSRDVERLQLKWLTYSFSMLLLTILTEELVTDLGDVPEWVSTIQSLIFALVVLFIPISVGIAITRYQLYEIDRIVSRTVSYTIVIGGLALVFAAGAVWLPQQLPTANNNLAVAASTLIVAALFNPLRRRVQSIVDRRFHRLPYDPERVASDLSAHLREQVDSGRIIAALVDSSTTALRPASAGAWIRRGI
ncbi:MAG: hypothetical protein EHM57_03155 [Actinobacteria bacterium]|nr:MAG: hypothetical protein EHM57_03155 [Actinomycetota bacterium]